MTQKHLDPADSAKTRHHISAVELAFRRGVVRALSLAADLVRSGASADDLDSLAAAPARPGPLPDVYILEESQ